MKGPNFIQITERRQIDPNEVFKISKIDFFRYRGPVRPTHLMVGKRGWAFAYIESFFFLGKYYKSSKKIHFFPIPSNAHKAQLPEAFLTDNPKSQTRYGKPRWFLDKGRSI